MKIIKKGTADYVGKRFECENCHSILEIEEKDIDNIFAHYKVNEEHTETSNHKLTIPCEFCKCVPEIKLFS